MKVIKPISSPIPPPIECFRLFNVKPSSLIDNGLETYAGCLSKSKFA
jgi:hypothetical protein